MLIEIYFHAVLVYSNRNRLVKNLLLRYVQSSCKVTFSRLYSDNGYLAFFPFGVEDPGSFNGVCLGTRKMLPVNAKERRIISFMV
jgi:hypothetical protein